MKFTDGYWLSKPNTDIFGCAEIRDFSTDGNTVTVTVSPFPVAHRAQTLGGPLLTLELSSPREDIVGVKYCHFTPPEKQSPAFKLNTNPQSPEIKETSDSYLVRFGKCSVLLRKDRFSMSFYYEGKLLTHSDTKQAAYITSPGGVFFRERLDLGVDETIYGLGERFTPFVKNGQSIDIWNEDGGTASEFAYKNIPFYISSNGFGVFVSHPERVSYEIASESASRVQFSVAGEELNYFVICGGSIKSAVANYCALTGKPPLPPAWSFGLWLSTSFTTDYDEETVNGFIDGMTQRGIPLSVFHYDCFWMKEYEWCNFKWDSARFPQPEAMLKRLHDKGLRVCVWLNPYIAQKSPLFAEAARQGFLLRRTDGSVWQWDMWQPGMGIVDFTNPEAAAWFSQKLKELCDMGVDCFKTDFGERIPVDGVVWHDGSNPQKMHNFYTYLYNKTVYAALDNENAVVFARSATAGCQQFPVHWGGDCEASYAAMAETLRGGLSLALSGFAFWSHDIGGFESTATPDLYKRWVAFGLFSTHSRLHGSNSYRVPWAFEDDSSSAENASEVLRRFVKIKLSLMPYLFAQAVKAAQTGIPVMRPMVMEYPGDVFCRTLDKQYMLGDSLLVAPVFYDDGHCDVYLPEGRFTNFFTGEVVEGGRLIKGVYNYLSMPVFIPENTLLARGRDDTADYDFHENVTVHAYQVTEQTIDLFDRLGRKRAAVTARAHGERVTFQVDGDAPGIRFEVH